MSLYRPTVTRTVERNGIRTTEKKQSKVYWMDFFFRGQRIRESTGMPSITRAREVQTKRKRELQDGTAGIRKREAPKLFSIAAAEFCEKKGHTWSASMRVSARNSLNHLSPVLGKRLLVDIDGRDVARFQKARLAEGASNRSVNIEIGLLRSLMRKHGLWARVAPDVSMLHERDDVGRALSAEEETVLLGECGASRSRILHPFIVLLLETGARFNTIRTLQWKSVDLANGSLKLGKDKTRSGSGRTVPLNRRASETLKFWARSFPDRRPEHFVFPREKYATAGIEGTFGFQGVVVYDSDPSRPIGDIKEAWEAAKKRTRYHCPECKSGRLAEEAKPATGYVCATCRWKTVELPAGLMSIRAHDCRHTAVSRMIAAGKPLPIIAKIVGWSAGTMAKMAFRYGHFSIDEMRSAVESISRTPEEIQTGYPKISPKSEDSAQGIIQ